MNVLHRNQKKSTLEQEEQYSGLKKEKKEKK